MTIGSGHESQAFPGMGTQPQEGDRRAGGVARLAWRRDGGDREHALPRRCRRLVGACAERRKTAEILLETNQPAAAERSCRQAIKLLEELASRSPQVRSYRRELGAAHDTMGQIEVAKDERYLAETEYTHAIRLCSRLFAIDPSDVDLQWRIAACMNRLAPLQRADGRWGEAKSTLQRGCDFIAARARARPLAPRIEREWVSLLCQLGLLNLDMSLRLEAVENFETAVGIQTELVRTSSDIGQDRERLVGLLINQSKVQTAAVEPAKTERTLVAARNVAERLATDFPSTARYQDLVASTLSRLAGTIKADPGRRAEARGLLERALSIRKKLAASSPSVADYTAKLAESYSMLADLCFDEKSYEQIEGLERKALLYQSRLQKQHPDVAAFRFGHGRALHNLADFLRERGRAQKRLHSSGKRSSSSTAFIERTSSTRNIGLPRATPTGDCVCSSSIARTTAPPRRPSPYIKRSSLAVLKSPTKRPGSSAVASSFAARIMLSRRRSKHRSSARTPSKRKVRCGGPCSLASLTRKS